LGLKNTGVSILPRNLKLTLAYDGHDFAGWQVQPDRVSVQGTLVSAIEHLTGEKTLPQGSGRTDAGVHALAQTASVTLESPIPAQNLLRALNNMLPQAIRVLDINEMPPDFHARRSATAKTYRYHIYRAAICSPFQARYVYHHPYPLDEQKMVQAAALVEGEHDFTSFAAVDPEKRKLAGHKGAGAKDFQHYANDRRKKSNVREEKSEEHFPVSTEESVIEKLEREEPPINNVRTIFRSTWQRHADELIYTVRGSGFLHHMVRNLVGTFLMVGKGSLKIEDVRRILHLRDRSAAAATAPASGLFLVSVEYE
jgi:tRNA pseudouridine38-40 synthase